ncbi:unnamed protein product [Diamesa hyperborea]
MFNLSSLWKINNPCNLVRRMYGKHNKKYLYKDGEIVNNIYYYPRNEAQQAVEEQITDPAKLFRVHRIKPVKGNPHWEKRILRELGLFQKYGVAIVKNIPENNARLWKIKHLIKIAPITFPQGEPSEEDLHHTYLKENGECIVIKNIDTLNQRLEAAQEFEKKENLLDGETLRKDSRLKWLNPW